MLFVRRRRHSAIRLGSGTARGTQAASEQQRDAGRPYTATLLGPVPINLASGEADADSVERQIWPDGYHGVKCLHRGAVGGVFSARRRRDGKTVVLKIFDRSTDGAAHARHEFDVLRACSHPRIPEAIELDLTCEWPCLVIDFRPGTSLLSWLEGSGVPSIEVALELAISWVDALAAVHAARVVHRDITPNNLLVDPETLETCLIDFGIAQTLGANGQHDVEIRGSGWAGTLQFIAPEQTGRLNIGCGFPSDLYGFGGTLYYLLTGRPPFACRQPLELINAHIARRPVAPSALRAEIPDPLSRLVLKLLEKEPEERYSNAVALHSDLVRLRDELSLHGEIQPTFELEAIEIPDRPRFSTTLHGREGECERLWHGVCEAVRGQSRVIFLEGAAGSGKSRLIDTLRPRLSEVGAYLIQGGFDPSHERPYAGWIGCLESLAQQILVESDARLAEWRRQLCAELGPIAGAILDLTPDFRPVLRDVAPLAALGPRQTRARLLLAIQRLLMAVGTPEHPLILFLDDFHLSDSGSRYLVQELFATKSSAALVLIVGLRPDTSEIQQLVGEVRQRLDQLEVPSDRIEIPALRSEALVAMLAETLGKPHPQVAPLASVIERKTGGNPLCVRQLVDHLHAQGLLRFEPGTGWIWDLDAIAGARVPEGAIPLLISKLDNLAPELRDSLSWASCAGYEFGADLLERLGGTQGQHQERRLLELERLGLVLPGPRGFRFSHERIREAARDRLTLDQRSALHAQVAMWMLERAHSDCDSSEDSFEIAQHLLQASNQLPAELRLQRVEYGLEAGRRALRSGAALEARAYLDGVRGDFRNGDWAEHASLGIDLWLTSSEGAFLSGSATDSLALLDEVQPRTRSEFEFARVEMQRLRVMALQAPPAECVAHGLRMLRRLGIGWPQHPSPLRVWLAMYRQLHRLRARARQGIAAPPGTPEPKRLAALMIINGLGSTLAREDVYLAALVTCFVIEKPMPSSMSTREAYSISNFGTWLQILWGDSKRALEIASSAHAWVQESGDRVHLPRLEVTLRGGLHPFIMRRRRALAGLETCTERLTENGDIEFAYHSRFLKAVLGGLGGNDVESMTAQLRRLTEGVDRSGFSYLEPLHCLQACRWLREESRTLVELEQAVAEARDHRRRDDRAVHSWEVCLWALVCCIYGRHDLAWNESQTVMSELFRKVPYAQVPHLLFYRAIAAASLVQKGASLRARKELKRTIRWMNRWASCGPDFHHMVAFLQAEQARLVGKLERAHRFYDQATRGAIEQEFLHHAALAKERRARLLFESRRVTEAKDVLRQAMQFYQRWGATGKVALLREALAGEKGRD